MSRANRLLQACGWTALAGMAFGQWLRSRVRPELFRVCFLAALLALGAHLALRGLR